MKGLVIYMKKGKVFSKRHIVVATLAVLLAGAVWLNMRYSQLPVDSGSPGDTNSVGENKYLSGDDTGTAVQVSAGVSYIREARAERNLNKENSIKDITAAIEKADVDDKSKKNALDTIALLNKNAKTEIDIETVIKAKGFDDALVMIADDSVTVIVPSEGLLGSQSLQIQDAVTSQIKIDLEKIKIISVK